ncbi:MAG: PilZ domain-containing protein [Sphingomonadaceae bacterium]|nr:PilZ domain-containing protein [Sphingomonadaceae bacterium]
MTEIALPPREPRSSVIIRAVVQADGVAATERRVRNLSAHGACIDHAGDLRSGQSILLGIGAYEAVPAQVIWARDKVAGVRFRESIDLDHARQPRRNEAPEIIKTGWLANMPDPYKRTA